MNDIINYSDSIGEPDRLLHNCYNFCKLWETCNYTASLNWKAQITLTDKFNMEATHDGTANPNNVTIRQRIINNIEVNRPVILGGAPEGLFSFPNINESHSWIAHGYKYLKTSCYYAGEHFFYMNWGWEGYGDGWCLSNVWIPNTINPSNYSSFRNMVYNIY